MDSATEPEFEISSSGTYVEGIGDEVVFAFLTLLAIAASTTFFIFKWINYTNLHAIHPDSQENVAATRSQLGINPDETQTDGLANNNTNASENLNENRQRYYSDRRCPICLLEARLAVETNCGHLFCGQCIITYWRYGDWLGAVQCPVCRQLVSLLMKDFTGSEDEGAREIGRSINDYNRRFSGQPRPIFDYIWDLPAILRHLWRELFSVGGLVFMFRARIFLCIAAIIVYLISPLDIIPEAMFGFIGLLDDLFILLLVLVYMTIIYRQIVAERA
uniref:E3 ubiquitin-protein ligase RNF170 n=1 Tax=Phallusia mammillata TaxID=59560 RepID=A0A6F9DRP4_9ASCI|nr:E3 ubiquitin-protein ligase RNF170 [Phallusia mammillata]